MIRLLVLLPVCLFFAPDYPQELQGPLQEEARPVSGPRPQQLAVLAVTPQAMFPATLPWPALGQSSRVAAPRKLPFEDPVVFLKKCLERYDKEVQGYDCIMGKRERVNGRLFSPEIIKAYFKEQPFSVFMRWLEGEGAARCALYVKGQNDGNMLVLPSLLARLGTVFAKDPVGAEAKQSGRYPITEFGIKIGMVRTLDSWNEARAHDALHIEYLGVYHVPKAGDRECFKLRRSRYARPEVDGITELTLYIDCKTWLQVGSELRGVVRGADGQLIAEYYFRDIHINPEFAKNQFERSALTP